LNIPDRRVEHNNGGDGLQNNIGNGYKNDDGYPKDNGNPTGNGNNRDDPTGNNNHDGRNPERTGW